MKLTSFAGPQSIGRRYLVVDKAGKFRLGLDLTKTFGLGLGHRFLGCSSGDSLHETARLKLHLQMDYSVLFFY